MAVWANKTLEIVKAQFALAMERQIIRVVVIMVNGARATISNSFLFATNLSAKARK